MDKAKHKLQKIAMAWNSFFLEYTFCNKKIRFDEDAKTNYFGDILAYFQDTLDLIKIQKIKKNTNYTEYILYTVGLLQLIYVQQDLIKQLLHLFSIDPAIVKEDMLFKKNRYLRNELIGHPINTEQNAYKLKSSILFGDKLNEKEIYYTLYSNIKGDIGIDKTENVKDIIERHIKFLNKYFDKIQEKVDTILKNFKEKISKSDKSIVAEIQYVKKLITWDEINETLKSIIESIDEITSNKIDKLSNKTKLEKVYISLDF